MKIYIIFLTTFFWSVFIISFIKDRHFGYNFWKWSNSKLRRQKDIFTKEEKLKIFEMMQKEFNLN